MFNRKRNTRILSAHRTDIAQAGTSFGTADGRPSGGSDRLIPTSFVQPFREPDVAAIRERLFAYIDEGARNGAFDDGSAAYADRYLFAQRDGWLSLLEDEYRVRRDSAAWIVGGRLANVTVASGALGDLQDRLDRADADQARLRAILLDQDEDVDVVARPGRGTAPLPHGLLDDAEPEPEPDLEQQPVADPTPLTAIRAVDDPREPASAQAR